MIICVVNAKLIKDFKLHIQFDNGESGVVDLQNVILNDPRKIFESLKDKDYFKSFSLDS